VLAVAVGVVAGLVLLWLAFVVVLIVVKPDGAMLREAARIVPDVVRLAHRLARDRSLHRGVRLRLWFLLAYLALPFDLVPDFVPVIGFADDAVVVSVVLRSVVRRAGPEAVCRHWPGTPSGLSTLARLCRLPLDGPTPTPG
jgi:uncharacterized membrane protein YkvA (DUF1232 family)